MFQLNVFLATVQLDNPKFKKIARTSSLDALIKELSAPMINLAKVQRIVAFLPFDKQNKYRRTLAYLNAQLHIHIGAIPAKAIMTFEAFRISKSKYKGYNARGATKIVDLDPTVAGSPGPRSFIHVHKLAWSSSNGDPAALGQIRTREYVKFLSDTQAAPFNAIQDPDREFYAPGDLGTKGGTSGVDDHSTKLPALICTNPRQPGSLHGQQKYQYSLDDGLNWVDMENGQFLLEKTVRQVGGDWVFTFKKTNWAPHNSRKFHFEVEYTIGPSPEYLPRADTDVWAGMTEDSNIKQYARRVVSRG